MSVAGKTGINFTSNMVFYIARLIIGILAMPICLHAFGDEAYGLYLLGFGLSSSLTVFDFGAAKSVFRYTIEYAEDKDIEKYSSALSGAWSLNTVAAIVIGLVLILIGFWSDLLFHISEPLAGQSLTIFLLAGLNATLLTLNTAPQLLLQARHYFHLRNSWQYVALLCNLILLLCVAPTNMSLIAFSAWNCGISLIGLCIDSYLVYRTRVIKPIPIVFTLRRSVASSFARTSFLHAAISFLSVQADRLIIGSVLNVSAVTTYTIITKPYFLLRGLVTAGFPTFQPALSGTYLSGSAETYKDLSGRVIRTALVVVVSLCGFIVAFFYPLLETWLHTTKYHPYVIWGMLSLLIVCITMLYTPHFRTLANSARLKDILRLSVYMVPLNVVISILLSKTLGFQGVIIGTLVQIIVECIYIYILMRKEIIPLSDRSLLPIYVFASGLALFSYFLSKGMYNAHTLSAGVILPMLAYIVALSAIVLYTVRKEQPFRASNKAVSGTWPQV